MFLTSILVDIIERPLFWFYFRKALFQIFIPIFLATISLCNFMRQSVDSTNHHLYSHLYFYTSILLIAYTCMKYVIEFIFNMTTITINIRENDNIANTPGLNMINITNSDKYAPTFSKKITKIKYSDNKIYIKLVKLCWILGIDCPILVPYDIIKKLLGRINICTIKNDKALLFAFLESAYNYKPDLYALVMPQDVEISIEPEINGEYMIPQRIISRLDESICLLQKELFGIENDFIKENV